MRRREYSIHRRAYLHRAGAGKYGVKPMSVLTENQAYAAMFHFLDRIYDRTKSNDLGTLLGGMSMLADGSPADPAIISEWRLAIEFALTGGEPSALDLR